MLKNLFFNILIERKERLAFFYKVASGPFLQSTTF